MCTQQSECNSSHACTSTSQLLLTKPRNKFLVAATMRYYGTCIQPGTVLIKFSAGFQSMLWQLDGFQGNEDSRGDRGNLSRATVEHFIVAAAAWRSLQPPSHTVPPQPAGPRIVLAGRLISTIAEAITDLRWIFLFLSIDSLPPFTSRFGRAPRFGPPPPAASR